jgi:NAD(P)-dependent dehydrogenase (short-subunit alcohol dehydrogenase family)
MVVAVDTTLRSIPAGGAAVIVGARGGVGRALVDAAQQSGRFDVVLALSRSSNPALDIENEISIQKAAQHSAEQGEIRLVIDATGFLHDEGFEPEKSWRGLDAVHMAKAFAVNAIGPALLMKHFLPLLPRAGKSVFATLSARVGSIADNRLGGWYSYRASKAALNQLVRTAAIELKRSRPEALCVAIHPGTTDTTLSAPFSKAGLAVQTPAAAAVAIMVCLERLGSDASGGFFDRTGEPLQW